MICPYCRCDDSCGRESVKLSRHSVAALTALYDLYSKDRSVLYADPLYVSQDLVLFGYFPKHSPPLLTDVGHAKDLIREVEQ